jgi:hypothetical protein
MMAGYLPTEEERDRFAAYLEEDARSDELLLGELVKFVEDDMLKRKKVEMTAKKIVANLLRSAESVMVG